MWCPSRSTRFGSSRMSSNTIVSGPSRSLGYRQSAGEGEHAHAGGARRLHARAAVLDNDAAGRRRRHPRRRVEEQIRGGFAVRDVLGAEDPAIEPLVQAGQPERVSQMVVGAARCDARGQRDPVERLKDAVDWRERVCERLAGSGARPPRPTRREGCARGGPRSPPGCLGPSGRRTGRSPRASLRGQPSSRSTCTSTLTARRSLSISTPSQSKITSSTDPAGTNEAVNPIGRRDGACRHTGIEADGSESSPVRPRHGRRPASIRSASGGG